MNLLQVNDPSHQYILNVTQHEADLLFQRLNFFLISTSFLIAGFVTTLTANPNSTLIGKNGILTFSYAIVFVGLFLSFLFTFINYLNSNLLRKYRKLFDSEIELDSHYKTLEFISIDIGNPSLFFKRFVKDLGQFINNPLDFKDSLPGSHTILIPLFFIIFWSVVFIWLPYQPIKLFGGMVIILFLLILVIYLIANDDKRSVLDITKGRYANGEINEEELNQIKNNPL